MSRNVLFTIIVVLGGIFLLGSIFFVRALSGTESPRSRDKITGVSSLPEKANKVGNYVPKKGATDLWYGPSDAPVTMYLYSDLECPYCKAFDPIMRQLLQEYPNDLAVTFRHYPIPSHRSAYMEAEIVECVSDQGDDLAKSLIQKTFEQSKSTGESFSEEEYVQLALTVGANETDLRRCFTNRTHVAAIDASMDEAFRVEAKVTPTTFLRVKDTTVVIYGTESKAVYDQTIQYLLGI